jgi:hypothetical protein
MIHLKAQKVEEEVLVDVLSLRMHCCQHLCGHLSQKQQNCLQILSNKKAVWLTCKHSY